MTDNTSPTSDQVAPVATYNSQGWNRVAMPTYTSLVNKSFLPQFWKLMSTLEEADDQKRIASFNKLADIEYLKIVHNCKRMTFEEYCASTTESHKISKLQVIPHGIVQQGNAIAIYTTYIYSHRNDDKHFIQRAMGWVRFSNENKIIELNDITTDLIPVTYDVPKIPSLIQRLLSAFSLKRRLQLSVPYTNPHDGHAFDTKDKLYMIFARFMDSTHGERMDDVWSQHVRSNFTEDATIKIGACSMTGWDQIKHKLFPLFTHMTQERQLHGGIRRGREFALYYSLNTNRSVFANEDRNNQIRRLEKVVYRSILVVTFADDCDKMKSAILTREAIAPPKCTANGTMWF